jgi:hypothetical protein
VIDAEGRERGDGFSGRAQDGAKADPLAAALLPVLLHDLNNATQYLTALNALLSTESPTGTSRATSPGPPRSAGSNKTIGAPPTPLAGLSRAAHEIDDLGWVLGLAANAGGADLLLDRRHRAGLEPLLVMVRKCLRREQRDLDLSARPCPDCAARPAGVEPWRVPWAIGSWLLAAGRTLPAQASLSWELRWTADRFELICRVPMTSDLQSTARHLESRLPGLAAREGVGECALLLAPGWLLRAEEAR